MANARADFGLVYTWRTWLGGWLLRVVTQVAFFALVGEVLLSRSAAQYLAVGNAVVISAIEAMMVVASTTWERRAGTLPLLVAAPGPLPMVLAGRSVQWLASGTVSGSVAFFAVGVLFGVSFPMPAALLVIPLIALVGLASYGLGLLLAGFVLAAMDLRNLVSNLAYLTLMAITGVQVPLSFWPGWLQGVAQVLPVTHGLAAVRALVTGGPTGDVLRSAVLEAAVGASWLCVALCFFRYFAEAGRHDGSIEFS
jgi:ABC-2 type transport system permease protein